MAILRVYNPLTQKWDPIPYIKGDKGDRGYDVTTVEYEYYSSTSSSEPTGGEWSTIMPGYSEGRYIWVRTKTTNSHGEVYTGTPILATLFNDVNSAELTRRTYETNRVNAETARDTAEGLRDSAETARASAELLRVSAETSRGNSEVSRANAEAQRVSAESSRVSVEAQRVANEEQRISNENARIAAQGRYPIVQNSTWWVWSKEDDDYVDTEVTAVGADGVGIASIELTSTVDLVDTYTITFDDGSTTTFDVTNGQDGISPTITVTEITGGHEVAVTDAEGTQTFDVMDGEVSEEQLETALIDKADVITSSASGEIVTISDGGNDLPVVDLKVSLLPVQDLHGQDAPYPPGGGTNLLDPEIVSQSVTFGDVAASNNGEYITISGTATLSGGRTVFRCNTITLKAGTYYIALMDLTGTAPQFVGQKIDGSTFTVITDRANMYFTLTEDTYFTLGFNIANGTTYATSFHAMIVSGSTAPAAYAPYSNICPISGWTGVEVEQSGKNLLPYPYTSQSGTYSGVTITANEDGTVNVSGTATGTVWFNLRNIANKFMLKAGSYVVNGHVNNSVIVVGRASDNIPIGATNVNSGQFTIAEDTEAFAFIQITSGNTVSGAIKPMIRLASVTDSTYEPYNGNTYPIDWTDEAGTVYGGSLDLTTGVLSVEWVRMLFNGTQTVGLAGWRPYDDSSAWLYKPEITPNIDITMLSDYTFNVISDTLKSIPYGAGDGGVYGDNIGISLVGSSAWGLAMRVPVSGLDTATKINDYLAQNPIDVVYKLTQPTTYQLTPVQIQTLLGTNNFWSNSNGSIDLEYRCDTKLYIQQLTKPSEDDMVANANIASGRFFMVGNRLMLSTTAIAQGEQIVVGTNCSEVSLADALNQINA